MNDIKSLIAAVRREAEREPFPVDTPVYQKAGRDPSDPVLFAGSLCAPVCIFARDLGKDEVAAGQPLIGAGGRMARAGLYRHHFGEDPPKSDRTLENVLEFALLTNTVPFKPPGNKAYSEAVKERFRPFLAALLIHFWEGKRIITLGNEAFAWFARYGESGDAERFWKREDRYEADWTCHLTDGSTVKTLTIAPLPHPSPLNARWYKQFPALLDARLRGV
jgi:uracil-DNA glycosylase